MSSDNNKVVYEPLEKALKVLDQSKFADFNCGENYLNRFLTRDLIKNENNGEHRAWVARIGDRLVGYITLSVYRFEKQRDPAFAALIDSLGVHKVPVVMIEQIATDLEFQKQKIGLTLMSRAFKSSAIISRSAGICGVALWAHPDAVAFYDKLGMIKFGEKPARDIVLSLMFLSMDTIKDSIKDSSPVPV